MEIRGLEKKARLVDIKQFMLVLLAIWSCALISEKGERSERAICELKREGCVAEMRNNLVISVIWSCASISERANRGNW